MATTDPAAVSADPAVKPTDPGSARGSVRRLRPARPDRVSMILFSFAGFAAVLAVLCFQFYAAHAHRSTTPTVLLRKVYRTTVVETVVGARSSAPAVTRSVSAPPSPAPTPVASAGAPTTRTS